MAARFTFVSFVALVCSVSAWPQNLNAQADVTQSQGGIGGASLTTPTGVAPSNSLAVQNGPAQVPSFPNFPVFPHIVIPSDAFAGFGNGGLDAVQNGLANQALTSDFGGLAALQNGVSSQVLSVDDTGLSAVQDGVESQFLSLDDSSLQGIQNSQTLNVGDGSLLAVQDGAANVLEIEDTGLEAAQSNQALNIGSYGYYPAGGLAALQSGGASQALASGWSLEPVYSRSGLAATQSGVASQALYAPANYFPWALP